MNKRAPRPDPGWWGVDAPLEPLAGGTRARVFRAGDLVLKTTHHSEAALHWLRQVAAFAAQSGLAVPVPLPTVTGQQIVGGWMAEPFIGGTHCAPNALPGLVPRLKRFHRATRRVPSRPRCPGAVDRLPLDTAPPAIQSQLKSALCTEAGDICAVHGDLNAGNILVSDAGIAVIDWDEARRDFAIFDHMPLGLAGNAQASLAWEVIACWRPEPNRARRLARMLLRGQARRFLADSLMASYWPEGRKRQR